MHVKARGAALWKCAAGAVAAGALIGGCGDGDTAHFPTNDSGVVGGTPTPGGSGGEPQPGGGGSGGVPIAGQGGEEPIAGSGGGPVAGSGGEPQPGGAAGAGGEPIGGTGGTPVAGAGGQGGDGGAGGVEPPPDGELPDFDRVAISTAGDTTYVFWGDANGLQLRAFGADLAWTGPTVAVADPGANLDGLAAHTVSEVPYLIWGQGPDLPIQYVEADLAGNPPNTLDITGRPLVTQLLGRLLVVGRAPGVGPGRPVAWQIVDPEGGAPTEPQIFEGPAESPDSVGSVGDVAVLRFGTSGQCLAVDATGTAFGNFICRSGDEGFINSDGLGARIAHIRTRQGDRTYQFLPLFGSGGYEAFVLGIENGATVDNPYPADNGIRPLALRSHIGAEGGRTLAVFADVDHLYRTTPVEEWPNDGTRALVRRGDQAVHVRFGYDEVPRLSTEPLAERQFEGPPYNFEAGPGVPAECVPTVEDCNDALDLDCDGRGANGLCCELLGTRWRKNFTPPGEQAIQKFAFGEAPNRDTFFMMVELADRTIRPYFVDFADRFGNVNAEEGWDVRDMQTSPRNGEPAYDLSGARDLVGYTNAGNWRATLAHDVNGQLGVYWGSPSVALGQESRTYTPVQNCEDLLAFDRVDGDDHIAGEVAVILVCRDRILRLYPRLDTQDQMVPLEASDGTPVRAEWATAVRVNRQILMIVVAFRTQAGALEFLRYQVSPAPGIGSPAGIASQPVGGGALGTIPDEERQFPIFWNVTNSAYIQLLAADQARARVATGESWAWTNVVVPSDVARLEIADLNSQLVGGGPLPGGGYGFWALSLGGTGGTNLWTAVPAATIQNVNEPLWQVTRGASNDDSSAESNGHLYPGILALYPDAERSPEYTIDLIGVRCAAP